MKRTLFFLYGVACHVMFLGVYGWMAAFVGGFSLGGRIPTIDTPPRPGEPLFVSLAVNVLLAAIFGVQHSVMARPTFKKWWTRFVPQPIERATYVLASNLCVMLMLWQWRPMGGVVWDVTPTGVRVALHALFAIGWLGVPLVSLLINHFDLFGTRQVWLHLRGKRCEDLPFRTPGAYAVVRHPLYVGWLVAFWATPTMTAAHLAFAVLLSAYIFIAIPFEERNLVEHFGEKYVEYRRRVGGLVPRLWGGSRLDLRVLRDVAWWSWTIILGLLVTHFATGRDEAVVAATVLCGGLAIVDLVLRRCDIEAIGVQVRLCYTVLLVIGLAPGFEWVHVMQLCGTAIRITVGYCLLERELRLMPWNWSERLTVRSAWQIFVARPCGGIVAFGEADPNDRVPCGFGVRSEAGAEPIVAAC
jgi:protein-S-isoprenylcysteine O-methyltransferase Ste14